MRILSGNYQVPSGEFMDDPFSAIWALIREHSSEIAAIVGSITSSYFTRLKTWRERFASAILGIPAAIYLGPVLYSQLPQLGENLSGYFMGFFGLNACAAVLKSIRRFGDDADFWTLLKELVIRLYDRYIPKKSEKE